MALVTCPTCTSDDLLVDQLHADGSKRIRCESCAHTWDTAPTVAPAPPPKASVSNYSAVKAKFPTTDEVPAGSKQRAAELKAQFLAQRPHAEPRATKYWKTYQQIFSPAGLAQADPQAFKDFANSNVGANPGNMSVFNLAWNDMGAERGGKAVRTSVSYLLHGPDEIPVADRLTHLIEEHKGMGMKGLKEALLVKVLCIAHPDRFIPIVKYTSEAGGKREILQAVYRVNLHLPIKGTWTIGRLVVWSNDLLLELIGDGFEHTQHAAEFLWWAKDQ